MKGTPVDPNYLPKGVPPEVAVAANAIADKPAQKPIIRFATGPKDGNYQYFGELLKRRPTKSTYSSAPPPVPWRTCG